MGDLLLALLLGLAIAAVRSRDLLGAVAALGVYSLMIAILWCWMNALDVAFTEAAVGAGISTVLMLATIGLTESEEHPVHNRFKLLPLLAVLLTGSALIYATFDMPHYGDPNAPIHQHVAPHYLEETEHEIGVPNIVTAVLASYRGYDTWGETTVIFTACIAVMMLLGGHAVVERFRRRKIPDEEGIE